MLIYESGARRVEEYLALLALAEEQYEAIRNTTNDVLAIQLHTGLKLFVIQRIKLHLFFEAHRRDGRIARFDADPMISAAWIRLSAGGYLQSDLDLLRHEYFESKLMGLYRMSYEDAHARAESKYPANLPNDEE